MKFKAIQIATILEGDIEGDPEIEISRIGKIEDACKGSLAFLANPKYTPFLYTTHASVVIVNRELLLEKKINTTLIRVDDSYEAFSKIMTYYNQVKSSRSGVEYPHFISDSAQIGENPYIGAFAYIGDNARIGDNVKIYPHVYIGENTVIGDNTIIFPGAKIYSETHIGKYCTVHSSAVIGSDGFGFAPTQDNIYNKIPQIGNVIIEDYVDVGAGTTIDRATLGSTVIRKGVKLDNQIQIAHNVEIGKNTVIAAQSGIAGSTKIGENCMVGGQVGFVGHLNIGNNVKIQAQSGVARSLKDDVVVQGTPAIPYSDYNKSYVFFKKLPDLSERINKLEKQLKVLKEKKHESEAKDH